MPGLVIVSAADSAYFPLLQELISSIRDTPQGADLPIGILDVGLTDDQRTALQSRVQHIVSPGWDFEFPTRASQPAHYRAMTARPLLPKYFPGYETILWIDADAWIQDGSVIDDFVRCAAGGRVAIVQELDRSYANIYYKTNSIPLFYDVLNRSWGEQCARAIARMPMMNSGVFAMQADSPLWQRWLFILRQGSQNFWGHLSEQSALNVAAYNSQFYPLPATHNWICTQSLPAFDPVDKVYVETLVPHQKIKIVHQSNWRKLFPNGIVKDVHGKDTSMDLTWGKWKR